VVVVVAVPVAVVVVIVVAVAAVVMVVVVVAALAMAVVVVVVVVYPLIPFRTQVICEASPSDCVARQPLNLDPCFAAFSCFLQNGSFPGFIMRVER
jgi:hypothetical protein